MDGFYVYGYVKIEVGVYCFVCIFFFDVGKCCYIFFVVVVVIFVFDELEVSIEIGESDLWIERFWVGGVGG